MRPGAAAAARAFMILALVALLALVAGGARARELPRGWTARDGAGAILTPAVADGRLETACTLKAGGDGDDGGLALDPGQGTPSVTIDLGETKTIHRVYWCGDAGFKGQDVPFPANMWSGVTTRVALLAGDAPGELAQVSTVCPVAMDSLYETKARGGGDRVRAPSTLNTEGDFRFPPIEARYLRLEARGLPGGSSWRLGEVEVYGFAPGAKDVKDAKGTTVVLPAGAPAPLALAARDLSYYVGEMLDRPVPVVTPDAAASHPGTILRIVDLKGLAKSREETAANLKSGALPSSHVNVEVDGREVVFRAWPYRNVLDSAWAFLELQGVRWTYPGPHGDHVPRRRALDLARLPLRRSPSADRIYANFDVQGFCPALQEGLKEETRGLAAGRFPASEGYLYFWRNHWTGSWNPFWFGGGDEVPAPRALKSRSEAQALVKDEYREGFEGYPHNFDAVLPRRVLEAHPDWMGVTGGEAGKRSPDVTPCFTNDGSIDFVAAKAAAWAALYPDGRQRLNLLPMDAARYCECAKCLALNGPLARFGTYCSTAPYDVSDAYYHFVCEVARRAAKAAPSADFFALAYANVFAPPRRIRRFPDNVVVEVCSYGSMNLPPASPPNAAVRSCLEEWAGKCRRLETYGYVLLNENARTWPMPLPLVTATAEWAKLQHRLGALRGGTQGSPEMIRHCPWNFYAYPRLRWDFDQDARALLGEFFASCYREAGEPVRAYYAAAEDHQIRNDASLYGGGYTYGLPPGAFPCHVLREMSAHLRRAETSAASWVTRRRLAPVREGFDWLLAATGVGRERLEHAESFPGIVPGAPPLTVAVKDADVIPSDYARGGDAYMSNGRRWGHYVRFERDGECVVSFSGNGYTGENHRKERAIAAYVNSEFSAPRPIPDGKGSYEFVMKVKKGIWEVGFKSMQFGEGPFYVSEFAIAAR